VETSDASLDRAIAALPELRSEQPFTLVLRVRERGTYRVSVGLDGGSILPTEARPAEIDLELGSMAQVEQMLNGEGAATDLVGTASSSSSSRHPFAPLDLVDVIGGTSRSQPGVTFLAKLLVDEMPFDDAAVLVPIEDGELIGTPPSAAADATLRGSLHSFTCLLSGEANPRAFLTAGGSMSGDGAYLSLLFGFLFDPSRTKALGDWSVRTRALALFYASLRTAVRRV
jgi:hypothetical protein